MMINNILQLKLVAMCYFYLFLGGLSLLVAVKFQIIVTFMILSSTSLLVMIATYLSYKKFFNKRKQFKY